MVQEDRSEASRGTPLRLEIPRVPLSPNQLLGRHWKRKHKEKQTWMLELLAAWGAPIPQNISKRMRVTITIYNSRIYDKDNRYGACKIILDAMKERGIIVDDRGAWLELSVPEMVKCPRGHGKTVIELEAIV